MINHSPMTYELSYADLGTLIIQSEVEPEFDFSTPELNPFVKISRYPSSLSEFYSLKDLVVIMDRDTKGNLKGFRIVKGDYRYVQEFYPFKEIREMEGDRYVLWDEDGVKVLFAPA